jgi:hypothetical protein
MRKLLVVAVASMTFIVAPQSKADITLTADITNGQEPGNLMPTNTDGSPRASSGAASFVLNDAMTSMTFTATVMGLDFTGAQTPNEPNDNLTAAHIHISDSLTFMPPETAGVRWGFFGAPFNDNNPDDHVFTPLTTGVGGTVSGKWDAPEGNNTTLAPWIDDILAGRAYINFHTTQFGGGEIRGALTVIPEPSTIALMAFGTFVTGAVACAGVALRRRAQHTR